MAHVGELNPFENAFSVLKVLQIQIVQLEAALNTERNERQVETAALQQALEQERLERLTLCQQLQHSLQVEKDQRTATCHRNAHDIGDLRAALEKEVNERHKNCTSIRECLVTEVSRLANLIEERKNTNVRDKAEAIENLEAEIKDRLEADTNLDVKFCAKTEELRQWLEQVARELKMNTKVTDADHLFIGAVANTYKSFPYDPLGTSSQYAATGDIPAADMASTIASSMGVPLDTTQNSPHRPKGLLPKLR
eukprot:TRINITY_DN67013_c0_g1_i1.p1 TRINITY_DN67013_c0_g1~~TRINITY_DN67013_c0_g1_i1.p1  ORF type:complete len:276 (+),score=56.80 TRINITY_DN67013_c0_g1_i1:75-830(+)